VWLSCEERKPSFHLERKIKGTPFYKSYPFESATLSGSGEQTEDAQNPQLLNPIFERRKRHMPE